MKESLLREKAANQGKCESWFRSKRIKTGGDRGRTRFFSLGVKGIEASRGEKRFFGTTTLGVWLFQIVRKGMGKT